ncbi:unnamed protein product, partial [Mesorhabditis belari]|uniref:Uncharacterized protein n=1 Tax=Mesorhabditis belari TaxID=2138241 RepID=A0AAF3J949_9BILA
MDMIGGMDFINQLNNFTLYRTNNQSFHSGYRYKYRLPFEHVNDSMSKTIWFQDRWHHLITISIAYIVLKQSLSNIIIAFVRSAEDFLFSLSSSFYDSVCRSVQPSDVAAFWALTFAVNKIAEFGDLLFIVLRKRPLM